MSRLSGTATAAGGPPKPPTPTELAGPVSGPQADRASAGAAARPVADMREDPRGCDWRWIDARAGEDLTALGRPDCKVWSAEYSPTGDRIVTASEDMTARVWDAATWKELAVLRGHEHTVSSASFSPGGDRVLTRSCDGTVRVWDAATGKELAMLLGHEDYVGSASFSPTGDRIVTASADKTARVWDAATGKELAVLRGHEADVGSASFSPAGDRIVTASTDKTARVWDAATWKELAVLRGHERGVESASFSPGGDRVLTRSWDITARVWDAATGQELAVLRGHEDHVSSASFSPAGDRVLTRSEDTTARVWDAATGKELAVLRGFQRYGASASFSPTGDRVLTVSADRTARVWDAATGEEIAVLRGQVPVTAGLQAIEVLAQDPDPAVVIDAAARERIKATGHPWRIRHTASGIVMLLVPPGEFLMGSPETEEGRFVNERQHKRTISKAFYLSRTQVSNAQWRSIMRTKSGAFQGDALPVEEVSWFDCKRFCELSGLRLPSEAEWEYACRAGTTTAYSFGETITKEQVCFGSKNPVACGSLPANPWGFHEMHGNVSEWVEDAYADYPNEAGGQEAVEGDAASRVLRGGSWHLNTGIVRSSIRDVTTPDDTYSGFGFRVARAPL